MDGWLRGRGKKQVLRLRLRMTERTAKAKTSRFPPERSSGTRSRGKCTCGGSGSTEVWMQRLFAHRRVE